MREFFNALIELLREGKQELENQPTAQISQFCYRFLKSFFDDKLENQEDFYTKIDDNQYGDETGESIQQKQPYEEEVNDIIMKIELKKFQKLIENRI